MRIKSAKIGIFNDPILARKWLESVVWPEGDVCPHCGVIGAAYQLQGKAHRAGVYKCKGCDGQFTVTVGTVMERSHIPLNKWLLAILIISSAKQPVTAHRLSKLIGITYKSAWFLRHRITECIGC